MAFAFFAKVGAVNGDSFRAADKAVRRRYNGARGMLRRMRFGNGRNSNKRGSSNARFEFDPATQPRAFRQDGEEARRNPTAYPGQFVGIANSQVVVVTDDLKELVRSLRIAEPDASKRCVVEPGTEVHAIWEIDGLR